MTEVIKEVVPGHPVAALTGPNIATEIMSGKAAAAVIATEDLEVARAIQKVVTRGVFRVYLNDDVVGCEMGGALKNVIAIAAGIGEGLGVGDNTRAAVMSRGLAELARLGVAMGAQPIDVRRPGRHGRPHRHLHEPPQPEPAGGRAAGQGPTLEDILAEMHMVAEGVKTASVALELAERYQLDLPICSMIDKVVKGEIEPSGRLLGTHPGRPRGRAGLSRPRDPTPPHSAAWKTTAGWKCHAGQPRARSRPGRVPSAASPVGQPRARRRICSGSGRRCSASHRRWLDCRESGSRLRWRRGSGGMRVRTARPAGPWGRASSKVPRRWRARRNGEFLPILLAQAQRPGRLGQVEVESVRMHLEAVGQTAEEPGRRRSDRSRASTARRSGSRGGRHGVGHGVDPRDDPQAVDGVGDGDRPATDGQGLGRGDGAGGGHEDLRGWSGRRDLAGRSAWGRSP